MLSVVQLTRQPRNKKKRIICIANRIPQNPEANDAEPAARTSFLKAIVAFDAGPTLVGLEPPTALLDYTK